MSVITCEQLPDLFAAVGALFTQKKEELCEMDAQMGDGDLGLTMSKGYSALPDLLRENLEPGDVGKTLMKGGMKMSSVVPSTMGTLMSSGVMSGGKALKGRAELDAAGLSVYLTAFAEGIQNRGKCKRGDRTILDALGAAADKAAALLVERPEATMAEVIDAAVAGADEGVEATKTMTPVFGKAAVFAAKAMGVPDQGAVAGRYMLVGMQTYIHQHA